jgi:hypothetical protein
MGPRIIEELQIGVWRQHLDRPKSIEINNVRYCRLVGRSERSFSRKHLRISLLASLLPEYSIEKWYCRMNRSPAGAGSVGELSKDAFGENLKVQTGIVFTSHSS